MQENCSEKYNEFNGLKALKHVNYWKSIIEEGKIPPPIFVPIDISNCCNFKCPHCHSTKCMKTTSNLMTQDLMNDVISLLKYWDTKTVCVAGGGSPLVNDNFGYFVKELKRVNIKVGVITNGYLIDKWIDELCIPDWVGISLDASTPKTFSLMKGVSERFFNRVVKNMNDLASRRYNVTAKFLIHPNNYTEIYDAAVLAKKSHCQQIQFRPGAETWFDVHGNKFDFSPMMIDHINSQLEQAKDELQNDKFKVYGMMRNYNNSFKPIKSFKKCYACYTSCVINASGMIELCGDNRGNSKFELCSIYDAKEVWGSDKHKSIIDSIDVNECPKCTLTNVNEIFENVIIDDKMMCDFI